MNTFIYPLVNLAKDYFHESTLKLLHDLWEEKPQSWGKVLEAAPLDDSAFRFDCAVLAFILLSFLGLVAVLYCLGMRCCGALLGQSLEKEHPVDKLPKTKEKGSNGKKVAAEASAGKKSESAQRTAKEGKRQQNAVEPTAQLKSVKPAPPAASKEESVPLPARTHRATSQPVVPQSFIRSLPSVDALRSSPDSRFLVISCRAKRSTFIVSQYESGESASSTRFLSRGKEFVVRKKNSAKGAAQDSGSSMPVTILEEAVEYALPASVRFLEIHGIEFVCSSEGSTLVASERNTDSFFVYRLGAPSGEGTACSVSLLQVYKMPPRRLVSSLHSWSIFSTGSEVEGVVSVEPSDCTVELLVPPSPGERTLCSVTGKLHVGTALTWTAQRDLLTVGGSFIRVPRLCRLELRSNRRSSTALKLELQPAVQLSEAEATAGSGSSLRVLAVALMFPGVPAFNTRHYWIVWFENGEGRVYNLDMSATGKPEVICTFHDTDYAEYSAEEPVRLLTTMQGSAYKERLVIVLVRGGNASVYKQAGSSLPFTTMHTQDLYGAADGLPLEHCTFLLGGRGLAVCGANDRQGIRLLELSE